MHGLTSYTLCTDSGYSYHEGVVDCEFKYVGFVFFISTKIVAMLLSAICVLL